MLTTPLSASTATTISDWLLLTALAVEQGARQIECTINGLGERAGNTSLEEVVMAIRTRRDYFKEYYTDINARKSSRLVDVSAEQWVFRFNQTRQSLAQTPSRIVLVSIKTALLNRA